MYRKWDKELDKYSKGISQYEWDELEELITDAYEDEKLSDEQFDTLMRRLMDLDCE
ncbi:MAG: hypothetical protein J1E62_07465 [Lachnospiraceae bacterium]|nr:hypothetical protein [Lachnospiraceae bacterium]